MQVPYIIRAFYPSLIWRINTQSKRIFLTFDDGPIPGVTDKVLDILDEYGWKATFFCVGENVANHPELFTEILKRNHGVGNHSFNHLKGFHTSTTDYVDNVRKASEYIDSKLFRPPHGRITAKQIKALKDEYTIIMWDVISYDYDRRKKPSQIVKILQKKLRKGSIVVLHDSLKAKDNVLAVLPQAIEFWQSKGYTYGLL